MYGEFPAFVLLAGAVLGVYAVGASLHSKILQPWISIRSDSTIRKAA